MVYKTKILSFKAFYPGLKAKNLLNFSTMILYEALNGIVEDGSEGVFLGFDGLRKLVCEVMSNAADKGKWQILMLVWGNIDADEVDKALAHEVFDGGIGEMVVDELRQTREKTVCQRLTIDSVDNLRQRKLRLLLKFVLQIFRQKSAVEVMQEALSHHSSTPFVAQDITQGRCMLQDVHSVVKTRIRTCA